MPIYEYKCEACGEVVEESRRVEERDESVTCACGKEATRILSRTSFALQGAGWARDGYGQ